MGALTSNLIRGFEAAYGIQPTFFPFSVMKKSSHYPAK